MKAVDEFKLAAYALRALSARLDVQAMVSLGVEASEIEGCDPGSKIARGTWRAAIRRQCSKLIEALEEAHDLSTDGPVAQGPHATRQRRQGAREPKRPPSR